MDEVSLFPTTSCHPILCFQEDESDSESEGQTMDDSDENLQEVPRASLTLSGVNSFSKRSHTCGELNLSHVNEKVNLYGWIEAKRGDNFIIMRDAYGSVQICMSEYVSIVDLKYRVK